MKKFILAAGMIFFLAACSNSDDNGGKTDVKGKGGKGDGGTQSEIFSKQKQPSVDTNSFWGIWESQQIVQTGINLRIRVQFGPSRLTVASECIYPDGVTLYAQVSSYATYYDNEVTTYENKEDVATFQNAGKDYSCLARVESETIEINIISGKIQGEDFVLTKVSN